MTLTTWMTCVDTGPVDRVDVAKELGHFLRTRRERLGPEDGGGSRRTTGLRREEVAARAAVSREYYTKLEQGRAPNPSTEVLDAVATALRLSRDEVSYMQDLAVLLRGGASDVPSVDGPDAVGARLVDAIQDRPAWVVDHRLDLTSWNAMASELLVDLDALPDRERNLSWLVFTNAQLRARCVQWDDVARQNVALLRGGAGRHPRDPRILELVDALSARSAEFARLWASHDVLDRDFGARVFEHPAAGRFELHYDALHLPGPTDRHLTVYSASDPVGRAALQRLRAAIDARSPRQA
ncbi:MAG: helix-turn-helix transcriptional regulator [Nocardioides alkalitolerans]